MPFENIIEKASEQLYADAQLRSNLTDGDATTVLDWAASWLQAQIETASDEADAQQIVEKAFAHLRPMLKGINKFAARGGEWNVSAALAALEPSLREDQPVPQTQVVALLTSLAKA